MDLIEVATVGNDGLVGLSLLLRSRTTPGLSFSRIPDEAARMEAVASEEAVADLPGFAAVLNRYTLTLFTQIAQGASCNRTHPVEQRCVRWLLMTHDRVSASACPLTHEFLSRMLGVRRAAVTEAVGALQKQELITDRRGVVEVLNRPGLEAAAGECYRRLRHEHNRLIG